MVCSYITDLNALTEQYGAERIDTYEAITEELVIQVLDEKGLLQFEYIYNPYGKLLYFTDFT